jgi:uncharacterized protein (DUF1330 family)
MLGTKMHFTLALFLATASFVPFSSTAQSNAPLSHAMTNAAPGYLLVIGKTTNRAKIGAYAAALPPIYASHDAYYLAIGGAGRGVTWLEGPFEDRSIILGKFPTRSEIDLFWWGDAYREAIKKRDNAGVFGVVALSGAMPLPLEGSGTGLLIIMTAPRDKSAAQLALSEQATHVMRRGIERSGGVLLTDSARGHFTPMEGDAVFDRYTIAVWPTLQARDAYLTSAPARRAARLRRKLGLSGVASANGVPRTQAPPAAIPPVGGQ